MVAELLVNRNGLFDRGLAAFEVSRVDVATGDYVQDAPDAGLVLFLAGDRERRLEEVDCLCEGALIVEHHAERRKRGRFSQLVAHLVEQRQALLEWLARLVVLLGEAQRRTQRYEAGGARVRVE